MVPQIECSWMGGAVREVGMGGLLFLACLAICPGVKMCTHRGCPMGQRWLVLTGSKPRPMSQSFSSGWQPSLSGTPTTASLAPPTSTTPLLDTLPHLSLSGTPAQGCQGQVGPAKMREDVCPVSRTF